MKVDISPLIGCSETYLWDCYLSLWRMWASNNISLMRELYKEAKKRDNVLSDCFASSDINQARALATILNELAEKRDD